jgi:hypothetical protein
MADGADSPGLRALYVIVPKGQDAPEIPIFDAGDRRAVAVFTDRNLALAFLQTARWEDEYEPRDLASLALEMVLDEARRQRVELILVNPRYQESRTGERQKAIDLARFHRRSGGELMEEAWSLAGAGE